MSIHHIDSFRYLFGEPKSIFASVRKDPRTQFAHEDGICLYILEYEDGLRAAAWDDVWAGPRSEKDDLKPYIKWRVEGTEGLAEGTLGWPDYPNRCPSTLTFTTTARAGGLDYAAVARSLVSRRIPGPHGRSDGRHRQRARTRGERR